MFTAVQHAQRRFGGPNSTHQPQDKSAASRYETSPLRLSGLNTRLGVAGKHVGGRGESASAVGTIPLETSAGRHIPTHAHGNLHAGHPDGPQDWTSHWRKDGADQSSWGHELVAAKHHINTQATFHFRRRVVLCRHLPKDWQDLWVLVEQACGILPFLQPVQFPI